MIGVVGAIATGARTHPRGNTPCAFLAGEPIAINIGNNGIVTGVVNHVASRIAGQDKFGLIVKFLVQERAKVFGHVWMLVPGLVIIDKITLSRYLSGIGPGDPVGRSEIQLRLSDRLLWPCAPIGSLVEATLIMGEHEFSVGWQRFPAVEVSRRRDFFSSSPEYPVHPG